MKSAHYMTCRPIRAHHGGPRPARPKLTSPPGCCSCSPVGSLCRSAPPPSRSVSSRDCNTSHPSESWCWESTQGRDCLPVCIVMTLYLLSDHPLDLCDILLHLRAVISHVFHRETTAVRKPSHVTSAVDHEQSLETHRQSYLKVWWGLRVHLLDLVAYHLLKRHDFLLANTSQVQQ